MLERESYEDGWQVRVPMSGVPNLVRLVPAAFLCVWLCGWAAGEYFAGGTLIAGLRDLLAPGLRIDWLPHLRNGAPANAPFVLAFLGLWVTFWTIGGAFAIGSLMALLFGVPIVRWNGEHVDFVVQVGPFSRRKRVALAGVREISPGRMGMLVLTGAHGRLPLGPFAEQSDAQQMTGWLDEARKQAGTITERVAAIG